MVLNSNPVSYLGAQAGTIRSPALGVARRLSPQKYKLLRTGASTVETHAADVFPKTP
jgi:hypothetical protein